MNPMWLDCCVVVERVRDHWTVIGNGGIDEVMLTNTFSGTMVGTAADTEQMVHKSEYLSNFPMSHAQKPVNKIYQELLLSIRYT